MRSANAGSRTIFATAACSLAITPGGVPARACRPITVAMSKPGKPCSAAVGTSGALGERRGVLMAKALTLPERMCGSTFGIPDQPACTSPASTAVTIALPPLYGTCSISMPARDANTAIVRWWIEPVPAEP